MTTTRVYCKCCGVWVDNGAGQYVDHILGKKHLKIVKKVGAQRQRGAGDTAEPGAAASGATEGLTKKPMEAIPSAEPGVAASGATEGLTKEPMEAIPSAEKPGLASGGFGTNQADGVASAASIGLKETSPIEASAAKPAVTVPGRPLDEKFEAAESIMESIMPYVTLVSRPVPPPGYPRDGSWPRDFWRNCCNIQVTSPVTPPDATAAFGKSAEDDALPTNLWRKCFNFQGTSRGNSEYVDGQNTQSASESSPWKDNSWGADRWQNNSFWSASPSDSAESGASGNGWGGGSSWKRWWDDAGHEDKWHKNSWEQSGWWTQGWASSSEERAAGRQQQKHTLVRWEQSTTEDTGRRTPGGKRTAERQQQRQPGWKRAAERQQQEQPRAPHMQGHGVAKSLCPPEGLQTEMPPPGRAPAVPSGSQSSWTPTWTAHRLEQRPVSDLQKGVAVTVPRLEKRPVSELQKEESLPQETGATALAPVQEEEAGSVAVAQVGSEGIASEAGLQWMNFCLALRARRKSGTGCTSSWSEAILHTGCTSLGWRLRGKVSPEAKGCWPTSWRSRA